MWESYERAVKKTRSWLEQVKQTIDVEMAARKVRGRDQTIAFFTTRFYFSRCHVTTPLKTSRKVARCTAKCSITWFWLRRCKVASTRLRNLAATPMEHERRSRNCATVINVPSTYRTVSSMFYFALELKSSDHVIDYWVLF